MPEWNKLPREMQEMVVKRATENTRNALKKCSTSSKILVEETRLEKRRSLYSLKIHEGYGDWTINMTPERYSSSEYFKFSTFEELHEKLIGIIKSIEFIKNFDVSIKDYNVRITPMGDDDVDQRRIFVENAKFEFHNWSQQENMLSQIEPVISAEKLSVRGNCSIREDQLLKLKASELHLENVNCSILDYISKCAFEAETTLPKFHFSTYSPSNLGLLGSCDECSNNEVMLRTLNPQLMLGIKFSQNMEYRKMIVYVNGDVRCRSESCRSGFWRFGQFQLRIIATLRISFKVQKFGRNRWEIFVERKSCAPNEYEFETIERFQMKLGQIMDNLDFIQFFEIGFKNSPEKINWKPREKQLMIDNLIVHGDSSVTSVEHLLQQVDPKFLRQVVIRNDDETSKNEFFYDLPQIQNATLVTIKNRNLQDHQLLKINNFYFENEGYLYYKGLNFFSVDRIINKTLTAKGINQFIKKCVSRGKAKEINFNLGKVSAVSNESEMFEGLDVVDVFEMRDLKRFVLNTVDSEYVMEIRISDEKHLSGYLIPRSEIKPEEMYHSQFGTYFHSTLTHNYCHWNL